MKITFEHGENDDKQFGIKLARLLQEDIEEICNEGEIPYKVFESDNKIEIVIS